jgi:AmpD protein
MNMPLTVELPVGLIPQARQQPSPNQDARSGENPIDLLVIHGISLPPSEFGGPYIDQLFTNSLAHDAHPYFAGLRGLTVSSHLLIRRCGELVQYVPFSRRAWHAGVSRWGGRTACNDFSIGIELEGCDDTPYTDAQYETLVAAAGAIGAAYPAITPERIVGHCHIAPGRKTDPGPYFDWARLRQELARQRQRYSLR